MLVADELFRIAHDDRTGRSRLNPRVLGLGLTGGLLSELVPHRRIVIRDGVIVLVCREPPPDPLAHATLAQLITSPQHSGLQT
ncbi:GPP34 family phosphoprotein [Dactylosporangium sp. NPDC050588]|uniref:GPP34 family phosphoprotein n=1 Tax=Dactylosporangium sp. NPDC050588 TaxID=3157211 RepID=UPI0033C434EC